jgi:DinB superfamily
MASRTPALCLGRWVVTAARAMDRGAGQSLREDGDFLYESFKKDWWNDTTLATHHHSEGGTRSIMKKHQVFQKLEQAWAALKESYTRLSDAQLTEPGVMGEWSIKDILAHVTTWEEEALKYLPLIHTGGRPPRYIQFGGIDAFNAQMAEQKRDLALTDVLRQLDETHRRLLDYLHSVPEEHFTRETPFRHRLRLDTYSHYPLHARAIQEWRERPME